ncbi:MAG: bactofilin family protein [Saprospiraceae bacterium]
MFGNNKSKDNSNNNRNTSSAPSNALNSLVQGTVVEGDIKSENDIRIDGVIKGTLTSSAKVIIGPTGLVQGEITCRNAMVEGRFEGVINVSELLNVRETAEMSGEIYTNKLVVQSGAIFNVSCSMGNQQQSNGAGGKQAQEIKSGQKETAKKRAS